MSNEWQGRKTVEGDGAKAEMGKGAGSSIVVKRERREAARRWAFVAPRESNETGSAQRHGDDDEVAQDGGGGDDDEAGRGEMRCQARAARSAQ